MLNSHSQACNITRWIDAQMGTQTHTYTHTLLLVHKCIVCINSLCVKVDICKGSNKWWKVFSRTTAVKLTIVAETVVHTVKWYQSILIWITIPPGVVRFLNLFWILTLAMFFPLNFISPICGSRQLKCNICTNWTSTFFG